LRRRYNTAQLKEVMLLLLIANDDPLSAEWTDHALQRPWADHPECHVGGDFLLIYHIDRTRRRRHCDIFSHRHSHRTVRSSPRR
jgi:addiction module RelE/StbE family toxin